MTDPDDYYEDARLWLGHRYEAAGERERFDVAGRLIPSTASSLLDVGCGNGAFLSYLEQTTGLRLEGIEPSEAARAATVARSPIVKGVADALPFPDHSFDVVSALEVIEHLRYGVYSAALVELRRVSRISAVISVPYQEKTDLTRCPECKCRFHPHHHMRTFDSRTMEGLLRPMRLAELEVVSDEDYLGGALLRRAYRLLAPGTTFPRTSVCPQCGFRGDDQSRASRPAPVRVRAQLANKVKLRLLRVRRPRWFVARYDH